MSCQEQEYYLKIPKKYFKQGLSQMWESILKYYEIHLKLQYKVLIQYHPVK